MIMLLNKLSRKLHEQEKPKTKESPILPMGDRLMITPVARKMAQAANLDIEKIQGTGPGGRITKEDVQKVIEKRDSMSVNTEERIVPPQPTIRESAADSCYRNEEHHCQTYERELAKQCPINSNDES